MAELQGLINALRKAHEAGNTEDARMFARELQRQQDMLAPSTIPPGPSGTSVSPQIRATLPEVAVQQGIKALSFPFEMAAKADRAITGKEIPRPWFGEDRMRGAAEYVGLPLAGKYYQPEGSAEELASGAALGLGTGPALKVVSKGVKAAGFGRAAQFIDPTGGRPIRGNLALGASGAGAEVLASAAGESAEDHGQNVMAAELVGALFGGAVPVVAGQMLYRGGKALLQGTAAVATRIPGVTGKVAQFAKRSVEDIADEVAARVETGAGQMKAAKRIKGLSPDPEGDAARITPGGGEFGQPPAVETGNLYMMRLYQDILDTDIGLSDFHAKGTRARTLALREAFTAPAEGATAVEAQTFIRQQRDIAEEAISLRLEQAQAMTSQRVAKLQPEMMEAASSTIAKEEIQSALDAVRGIEKQAWDLVPDSLRAPTDEAFKEFDRILNTTARSRQKHIPAEAREFLERGLNTSYASKESVAEVRGLMGEMRDVARRSRAEGNSFKAKLADDLADAILRDLESIEAVSEPLKLARAVSRDVRAKFRERNIGRLLGSTRTGGESVPGPMALGTTIGGGGAGAKVGMDEITTALEAGAAARKAQGLPAVAERGQAAVEDYLKLRFARFTSPQGDFNVEKAVDFLRTNADLLATPKLSGLNKAIREAISSGELSRDMQALVKTGLKEAKGASGAKFAAASYGQEFNSILAAGDPAAVGRAARNLVKTAAGDKTGRASLGLKATLFDHLMSAGESAGELSGKAMRAAFDEKRVQAIAREFLKPGERTRLGKLIQIITNEELMRGKLPSIGGVFDDKPARVFDILVRLFSAETGTRMSKVIGKGNLVMPQTMSTEGRRMLQSLNVDQARAALSEAVFDGEFMKTMLLPFDAPGNVQKIERVFGPFFAAQMGGMIGGSQTEGGATQPPPAVPAVEAPAPRSSADLPGVDAKVLTKLSRLEADLGVTLRVTSGLRTEEENAEVRGPGGKPGAKKSKHLDGKAIDIDVSDMSNDERRAVLERASALGFTGIGVYKNSIHLDTGRRRAWGPSYKFKSVPAWADLAIKGHMARKFKP